MKFIRNSVGIYFMTFVIGISLVIFVPLHYHCLKKKKKKNSHWLKKNNACVLISHVHTHEDKDGDPCVLHPCLDGSKDGQNNGSVETRCWPRHKTGKKTYTDGVERIFRRRLLFRSVKISLITVFWQCRVRFSMFVPSLWQVWYKYSAVFDVHFSCELFFISNPWLGGWNYNYVRWQLHYLIKLLWQW